MQETHFKQTEIGEVPEDWEFTNVRTACSILTGFPFNSKLFNQENGLPLIRIRDLFNITTEARYSGEYSEGYLIRPGDILAGMDGDFTPSKWKGSVGLLNQRVCKIVPKDKTEFEEDFVYYQLYDELKKINQSTARTTVKHLSTKDFSRMYLVQPPLAEQRKIASVLTTADGAIEKTNEIIEQSKQVKKGLMQDLLTRGIGHKKFKETELGEIPEEWLLLSLREICLKTEFVNPKDLPEFKYVDVSAVSNERFAITQTETFNGKTAPGRARKKVAAGDVIFATIRPVLNRVALIPKELDGQICSTAFCVIRADPAKASSLFLFFLLQSEKFNSRIVAHQVGAAYPAVSDKLVLNEMIALPPKWEQEKIASTLWAAYTKIESEVQKRAQFETLKKGLMQDLLTGQIRFPEFVKGGSNDWV